MNITSPSLLKLQAGMHKLPSIGLERTYDNGIVHYCVHTEVEPDSAAIDLFIEDLQRSFNLQESNKTNLEQTNAITPNNITTPINVKIIGIGCIFNPDDDPFDQKKDLIEWGRFLKDIDVSEADNVYNHFLGDYDFPQLMYLSRSNKGIMTYLINKLMNKDSDAVVLNKLLGNRSFQNLRNTFENLEYVKFDDNVKDAFIFYISQFKDHLFRIEKPEDYKYWFGKIAKFVRRSFSEQHWNEFTDLLIDQKKHSQTQVIADSEYHAKVFSISLPNVYKKYRTLMVIDDVQCALSVFNLVIDKKLFDMDRVVCELHDKHTMNVTLYCRDTGAFTMFPKVFDDILVEYASRLMMHPSQPNNKGRLTQLNENFEDYMSKFIDSLALRYELNNQPLQVNKPKIKI